MRSFKSPLSSDTSSNSATPSPRYDSARSVDQVPSASCRLDTPAPSNLVISCSPRAEGGWNRGVSQVLVGESQNQESLRALIARHARTINPEFYISGASSYLGGVLESGDHTGGEDELSVSGQKELRICGGYCKAVGCKFARQTKVLAEI